MDGRDRNSSGQGQRRQQYQAAMTSGSEGGDGDTAVSDQLCSGRNFPLQVWNKHYGGEQGSSDGEDEGGARGG